MKALLRIAFLVVLAVVSSGSLAFAQGRRLDVADLTADPPLSGPIATDLAWRPRSSDFSYVVQKRSDEEGAGLAELWIDSAAGAASGRRVLLSTAALAVPDGPSGTKHLSLEKYKWSPDGQSLLLTGAQEIWLYRLPSGPLERLTKGPEDEEVASFSPDGSRVAFVRSHDLWILDLATKAETRLTSDGSEAIRNGLLDWVYEEELASRSALAYHWSPDGRSIAYLRLDDSAVPRAPIVDFLKVPAAVAEQRYPTPADPNPTASVRIVSAQGATAGKELARYDAERDSYVVPGFAWTADSKSIGFRTLTRAQNHLDLRLLDAGGASRVLLYEDDSAWINVLDPPRFLPDGRFLWRSERTGFAHLYVGSLASPGAELKTVTLGDWMVDHVGGVDEKKGLVYFSSTQGGARRRGIRRARLDGKPLDGKGGAALVSTAGTHQPELSPDGRFLLDTWSSWATPPAISLYSVEDARGAGSSGGARKLRDAYVPESRLVELAAPTLEEVEVTADDGAKLYARLIKPARFDANRKYPVVVYVYGGPHGQVVRDEWSAGNLFDRLLADRGFLVWSLDNRGSWGRGHAWVSALNREMGKRELTDQLAGVRYLKTLPYVVGSRIGIWGGSYGGYLTLYALVNSPETWKCGVAAAPVTDWKLYDSIYTERYMKTPAENPKGYEASAPLAKAARLRAPLLLVHGTADDNVHLQNTIAFVDALVKAGRPYELQLTPGQKHGFRGKAALDGRYRAILSFFEKNL
jgi:dipeptidyl-peptidase-4